MNIENFKQTLNESNIARERIGNEFDAIMDQAKATAKTIRDDINKEVKRAKLRIAVDNTTSMKTDYEQLMDFSTTLSRGYIPEWKAIMLMKYAYRLPDLIEDEDRGPKWIHRVLADNNLSEVGSYQVYTWIRNHVKMQKAPIFA